MSSVFQSCPWLWNGPAAVKGVFTVRHGSFKCSFSVIHSVVFPRSSTRVKAISSKNKERETKVLDSDKEVFTEEELKYKPLGFGHGKAYDTSLEDKLLEEIERDKAAQAAALLRRNGNAASRSSPKNLAKLSASKSSSTIDGVKVWVGDLPKKKNIKRDLQSAFKHVPGLLDIVPSVVGNEKTRDPVCKGFGHLIFDTSDHAESCISSFQGQPVSFGKVEKQITFRIISAAGANERSSIGGSLNQVPRLRLRDKNAIVEVTKLLGTKEQLTSVQVCENALNEDDEDEFEESLGEEEHDQGALDKEEEDVEEEELDGDGDLDLDNELEIEVTSFVNGKQSSNDNMTVIAQPQGTIQPLSEADKRIEELEKRLRQKLEDAGYGSQKSTPKEIGVKPRGFSSKKSSASKQIPSKGNSVAAVTNGLKKREREFMLGVFEKYGKSSSSNKR